MRCIKDTIKPPQTKSANALTSDKHKHANRKVTLNRLDRMTYTKELLGAVAKHRFMKNDTSCYKANLQSEGEFPHPPLIVS